MFLGALSFNATHSLMENLANRWSGNLPTVEMGQILGLDLPGGCLGLFGVGLDFVPFIVIIYTSV